jgi:Spy/CpxP family protein refolding chaperone
MKTHRIILSITLALGGLLAVASAGMAQDQKAGQEGKKGRQNVEQRLNTMAEELKLTAEQKTKVKALLEDQAKKMEAMRGEMQNLSQEERRAKMQTNREEMNKKMKEILTADQYTKYEAQRAEMRKKGEGKKQEGEGKKKTN